MTGRSGWGYYGILQQELTADGNLRYLDLQGASRKLLGDSGDDIEPYEMPGEHFVIDCKNVETIDIDYFWVIDREKSDTQPTPTEQGDIRSKIRQIAVEHGRRLPPGRGLVTGQ